MSPTISQRSNATTSNQRREARLSWREKPSAQEKERFDKLLHKIEDAGDKSKDLDLSASERQDLLKVQWQSLYKSFVNSLASADPGEIKSDIETSDDAY